jgi:ADP-heptose:LPS heptosyltransferase
MKVMLVAKGVKPMRNGKSNPREYPYWDELIRKLQDKFLIVEVEVMPLPELKQLILSCDIWIAVESFFQHYAWSLGKYGYVLWGQGDPLIFGHKENVNLIKDRKNIRSNVFEFWENAECKPETFLKPDEVLNYIK